MSALSEGATIQELIKKETTVKQDTVKITDAKSLDGTAGYEFTMSLQYFRT